METKIVIFFIKNLAFILSHPILMAILITLIVVVVGHELIPWLVERRKHARWWSSLDRQWKATFKIVIKIKHEPTADELVTILSLTQLDCHDQKLTNLKPLRALTGLQTLDCSHNRLTSLGD